MNYEFTILELEVGSWKSTTIKQLPVISLILIFAPYDFNFL